MTGEPANTVMKIKYLFEKNLQFTNDILGTIELKYISYRDTWDIIEFLSEPDPRRFAERVIHHQLLQPKVELTDIATWQDEVLVKACNKLLDNASTIKRFFCISTERTYFEDFQAAFVQTFKEQRHLIDEIAVALQSQLRSIEAPLRMAQELRQTIQSIPKFPTIPVHELQLVSKHIQAFGNFASSVQLPTGNLSIQLITAAPISRYPVSAAGRSIKETSKETIGTLLNSVDPKLEERRTAAWETFCGTGTDKLRQAAYTMREVFRQLLDTLAPEDEIPDAQWYVKPAQPPYVTRRMRVRFAITGPQQDTASQSTLNLIDALADSGDAIYAKLSSETHSSDIPSQVNVEAFLGACDSIMLLILGNRS